MIVAIEGIDQAGKNTQTEMLADALKRQDTTVETFSFPDYATPIGREIRLYLEKKRDFAPQVIHCLLSANRWEKLDQIRAAASKNRVVLMNRYYHSNLIYGLANGMETEWLEGLDRGLPESDLVLVLDMPANESFHRKDAGRDRFEGDDSFLKKIRDTYGAVAETRGWKVINAARPKEDVHRDIMETLLKAL